MARFVNEDLLIAKLREGDEEAFHQLFNLYYPKILNSAIHLLNDQVHAEDVCQEVFVALWKNREKLPERLNLFSYLKRAAINRSLNLLKSRRHHIGEGAQPLENLITNQSPEKELEQKELGQIIQESINSLPVRCRTIYILRRNHGFSHNEIASMLGISNKTIENQMTKALKALKEAVLKYQKSDVNKSTSLLLWGICMFQWFYL